MKIFQIDNQVFSLMKYCSFNRDYHVFIIENATVTQDS